MFMSEATTRSVRVSVISEYAPDRSRPTDQQWFFLYTITNANGSEATIQQLSRHWIIPDATGEQPVLAPGEEFTYTSGATLRTSFGTMEGTYDMVNAAGTPFEVTIPKFTLSEPYTVH